MTKAQLLAVGSTAELCGRAGKNNAIQKVGKRLGDIADLPTVLRDQLRGRSTTHGIDEQIMGIVRDFDGVAQVDEIMVALWRKHKVLTEDRRALANRLYRLTVRGQLRSVKGRKGVYEIAA